MFTKGYIPWNKGKKCPILGLHKIGIEPWNKGIKTGLAPWKGKKRPELKNSGSLKTMFKKGSVPWNNGMSDEYSINPDKLVHYRGRKPWNFGKPFMVGESHWNWQGGKSKEKYGLGFNKWLKTSIIERDGNECAFCHLSGKTNKLNIHHKDYNKKNNNPNNLITLCVSCHTRTNYKRDFWITCFKNYVIYSR